MTESKHRANTEAMFRIFLFLVSTIIGIVPLVWVTTTLARPHDWKTRIGNTIQQHIDEDRNIGVIVGVIKENETWIKGFGTTDLEKGKLPSERTLFEIGSVSKVFTGLALARLVTNGQVSLDDPVSKFIPELSKAPAGSITLKQLTTHTSGLPRLPNNLKPSDESNPYSDYNSDDLITFLKEFKFSQSKPFQMEYSNVGMGLLGYVLSLAYGDSYENLIQKLISLPLKMHDTRISIPKSKLKNLAKGYDSTLQPSSLWDFSVLVGAGGIRSNLSDMLRFLKANIDADRPPNQSPLNSAIQLSHEIQATTPSEKVGLGWFFTGAESDPILWHNGQTGGFHSLIAFKKNEKTGVVLLTNTASGIECVKELVFDIDCTPKKEHRHSTSQMKSFIGTYQINPDIQVSVTQSHSFLVIQLTGQNKIRMRGVSENTFDVGGIAKITFKTNDKGIVERLILSQKGQDIEAKKIL